MKTRILSAISALAVLSACAVTPSSIVQQPTTTRSQQMIVPAASNGTIFQPAQYRPMFEDRRARLVGDTLTIIITEKTNANKAAANASTKSGSASAAIGQLFGVPGGTTGKFGVAASNSRKLEDKDSASSGNNFDSTLTVTVVDVLPNGNLVVSGEKQIALDYGVEFVRFSGVVNPTHISSANTVPSPQVADARAEYRTNTQVDKARVFGAMTKFFFSVLPM